jgi:hypothetical protein
MSQMTQTASSALVMIGSARFRVTYQRRGKLMLGTDPDYRALMSVDIEKSAGRGDAAMAATKRFLGEAMQASFRASGLSWDDCHQTDLGDGLRLVFGRDIAKSKLLEPFLSEMATRFLAHNRSSPSREQMRLRVAMHAGEVRMADGEVIGAPLETLARLLDAPPLKAALSAAPASRTVALGMSQHFYDEVVARDHPGIASDLFVRAPFTVKETESTIWLHVPGYSVPTTAGPAVRQASVESQPPSRWTLNGRVITVAADQAQVGQMIGSQTNTYSTAPSADVDGVRRQMAELRRALADHQRAGRLDEDTYEAAVNELRMADDFLVAPDEKRRSRFILAMRRLKGLVDDVADLVAKVAAIMQAARSFGG